MPPRHVPMMWRSFKSVVLQYPAGRKTPSVDLQINGCFMDSESTATHLGVLQGAARTINTQRIGTRTMYAQYSYLYHVVQVVENNIRLHHPGRPVLQACYCNELGKCRPRHWGKAGLGDRFDRRRLISGPPIYTRPGGHPCDGISR